MLVNRLRSVLEETAESLCGVGPVNSLWRSNKGCFTPVSNHLKYKAILKESLLEADGSEPMKWLKSNHIYGLECPSQSADLNQIQNLHKNK